MDDQKMKLAREMVQRMSIPVTECGCWLWEGSGVYGRVTFNKKRMYAHRLAYTAFKGTIPSGDRISHNCHVQCCVNPNHLNLVHHIVDSDVSKLLSRKFYFC